jgi:hypothetical protein
LQRQFRVLPAYVHRVKLNAARLTDVLIRAFLPNKAMLPQQALFAEDKPSGLFSCDRQHVFVPFIIFTGVFLAIKYITRKPD